MSAVTKINWNTLTSNLRPEVTTALLAFRRRHADLQKQLLEIKQQTPTIDFNTYSNLSNQKLVQEAKSNLSSFKPQTYDLKEQLNLIEKAEKEAVSFFFFLILLMGFNLTDYFNFHLIIIKSWFKQNLRK